MMLPGNVHEDLGQTYEQAFQTSVEEYKRMVDIAQQHNLQLNFEPCIMSIALEPDGKLRGASSLSPEGSCRNKAERVPELPNVTDKCRNNNC